MMKKIKIILAPLIILLLLFAVGMADPNTGEQINWQVVSSGGARGTSTNYILNGTVGQTAVGTGSSANYGLNQGYWQTFDTPGCCVLRGDVALPKDGAVLVNDIVSLVNYIFKGGTAPTCIDEGDCAVPLDGAILVNDIVSLVNYIFKGGATPPAC